MGQPGQGRSALPSGVVVEELGGTTCSERAKVATLENRNEMRCLESQNEL